MGGGGQVNRENWAFPLFFFGQEWNTEKDNFEEQFKENIAG